MAASGFFLVDDAVNDNSHLRSKLSDQVDGDRMLADGANRLIDDDLAAIDFGANRRGEPLSNVAIGDRTEQATVVSGARLELDLLAADAIGQAPGAPALGAGPCAP